MRRALTTLVVIAAGLAAATAAPAATTTPKGLWATINICDTETSPNDMGVRASIPGDGDHTRMYIRITPQYYDRPNQTWSGVKGYPSSGWIYAGSGLYKRAERGFTFEFDAPQNGATLLLRGAVDFKWVKKHHTVRTFHLVTKGGHPGTVGADPKDYSAPVCNIT